MATITTTVARHYAIRMIVLGVVCAAFGVWGAYDLFVKIPREEERADRFQELTGRYAELEQVRRERGRLDGAEAIEAGEIERELATFEGSVPERPGKFDRAVQIIAMSCLLATPYFLWVLLVARRRTCRLEDDGTLVLPGGERWERDSIAAIDMSRWMSKSIATVVHEDGRRLKLDDYVHQGVDRVVGGIASRLHPGEWDEQARRLEAAKAAS